MENKAFCIRPFNQYSSFNDCYFRLCCTAYEGHERIETRGKKLEEIFQSPYMSKIREQITQGIKIPECEACYELEGRGIDSDRIEANRELKENNPEQLQRFMKNEPIKTPEVLDLRVGNICNLKCQSCFADLSVGVYDDLLRLRQIHPSLFPKLPSTRLLEEGFTIEQIQGAIPNLKKIKIIGGEPLLSEAAFKLLEYCVYEGHSENIELILHSNLTLWRQDFFELSQKFKRTIVHFSMDGVGGVNDYLRYPSRWDTCVENLRIADDFFGRFENMEIGLSPVFQLTNLFSFVDFLRFLVEDMKWFDSRRRFAPIVLVDPEHYSPYIAPIEMRKQAVEKFQTFYDGQSKAIQSCLEDIKEAYLSLYTGNADKKVLRKYVSITRAYDKMRNNSILQVFPQFSEIEAFLEAEKRQAHNAIPGLEGGK